MKRTLRSIGCFFAPFLLLFTASAEGADGVAFEDIQFYYEVFPPYIYMNEDDAVGTVIDATLPILRKAHIKPKWQQATFGRIIRDIESGEMPVCATGYNGKAIEIRTFYASEPVAWIPGTVLMILGSNRHLFEKHKSIGDVMSDEALRGGFLNGANYRGISGEPVTLGPERHLFVGGSDTDLAILVARGRVHFAPVTEPQIAYLKSQSDIFGNLEAFAAQGLGVPRQVGIVCSNSVGEATWRRIEAAVPPLLSYEDYVARYLRP